MGTSRLTINPQQVSVILPALEAMVNGIADARRGLYRRCQVVSFLGQELKQYPDRRFDEAMASHVLAARNKLKQIPQSRIVYLNSFELAAAALALRVVRRERLAPEEMLEKAFVQELERLLEIRRKRAKRSTVKEVGLAAYTEEGTRWRRFVQWARFNLLCYRPNQLHSRCVLLLQKEQRETMREIAREILIETIDAKLTYRLADLARREIIRERHETTLGLLLSDLDQARQFMAKFILKRVDDLELIRPEFQPAILRFSMREGTKRALVLDTVDSPTTSSGSVAAAGESSHQPTHKPEQCPHTALPPWIRPAAIPIDDLSREFASWFNNEVEPGYRQDVADEIRHQVWNWPDRYKCDVHATEIPQIIKECRPAEDPGDGPEMINFFAEWGAKWLSVLSLNPRAVCSAVEAGFRLAREEWKRMDRLTRESKLSEIYRRYFI